MQRSVMNRRLLGAFTAACAVTAAGALVGLPVLAQNGAPNGGTPNGRRARGFRRPGPGTPGANFGGRRFNRPAGPVISGANGTVRIEGGGPTGPAVRAPTTFRVATPEDGTIVRGLVTVQVPAGSMPDGSYVSFAINEPMGDNLKPGEGLTYATIKSPTSGTFQWTWDTRALTTGDRPLYPDGNYTIYAIAHDPLGREMANGEAQVTVRVNNFLPATIGPIRLSYHLRVGDQEGYRSQYTLMPDLPGDETTAPRVTGSVQWNTSVDDIDRAAGIASLSALFTDVNAEDQIVMRDGRLNAPVWSATFFGSLFAQKLASFDMSPDGEVTPVGRPGPYDWARTGLASNIYIPLQDQAVNIDDRWNGPMVIWTVGNPNHRTKVGDSTNRLVAFEWMDGYKTAKIQTTYEIDLPPAGQATTAAPGSQLGSMGASFRPGGYPGMGGSYPGMGGGASAPVMVTGRLTGERITWLDFVHGRVIRVYDRRTITNLPSLFAQDAGGTAGAGGGGYPGMGGGGYPGMGGGGMATASSGESLSWLPGFQFSRAAVQELMSPAAGGYPGMGGGYPGMGGGYPGMGGGYPGMGGGYPGMGGGYPGMPMMGGGYPGMGGGYPGMGGGYPGMGGGYPGMGGGYPGMPGGYPGMPGGYPGMPGGYPGMPGGFPGSFGNGANTGVQAAASAPPTFDEIIETVLVGAPGGGSSVTGNI